VGDPQEAWSTHNRLTSGFFATHLQSLLKIITVCPLQTTQHLAFRTLQACDESQNFPGDRGQNMASLLGKILENGDFY
jgi:hypothetical protein